MWRYLCPNDFVQDIHQIDLRLLKKQGMRGIIADLDNTLVPWKTDSLFPEVIRWVNEVKEKGFKVCIVSNNFSGRGEKLAEALKVPAIWRAVKPRRGAFRQAMETMGLESSRVAVVGDQVFTDVLGGNRLGLYTILVRPMDSKEFIGTRLIRQLEKLILFTLRWKGDLKKL